MDEIRAGDDVTVCLIVCKATNLGIFAKLKSGAEWFIPYEDIKTHRPAWKGCDTE